MIRLSQISKVAYSDYIGVPVKFLENMQTKSGFFEGVRYSAEHGECAAWIMVPYRTDLTPVLIQDVFLIPPEPPGPQEGTWSPFASMGFDETCEPSRNL